MTRRACGLRCRRRRRLRGRRRHLGCTASPSPPACSALLTASSDGVVGAAAAPAERPHVALKSGRRQFFELALDVVDAGSRSERCGQRLRLVERAVRGHGLPVKRGAERVQRRERCQARSSRADRGGRRSAASSSRRRPSAARCSGPAAPTARCSSDTCGPAPRPSLPRRRRG